MDERAAMPNASLFRGFFSTSTSASSHPETSPGRGSASFTNTPVTPSLTMARFTPTSSVTTGSPLAIASIRLFGNTSVRLGKKNTSPLA